MSLFLGVGFELRHLVMFDDQVEQFNIIVLIIIAPHQELNQLTVMQTVSYLFTLWLKDTVFDIIYDTIFIYFNLEMVDISDNSWMAM